MRKMCTTPTPAIPRCSPSGREWCLASVEAMNCSASQSSPQTGPGWLDSQHWLHSAIFLHSKPPSWPGLAWRGWSFSLATWLTGSSHASHWDRIIYLVEKKKQSWCNLGYTVVNSFGGAGQNIYNFKTLFIINQTLLYNGKKFWEHFALNWYNDSRCSQF